MNIRSRQFRQFLFLMLSCVVLGSCDLMKYHPYDVHITGTRDINATNIARIEAACKDKDTIRFVAMGDSQRFYDETQDFVTHINGRTDIDFVIHGGDFTDFGATDEFLWQRDILQKLSVPYVGIIGNHDCLGNGRDAYEAIWGATNFSFIAGKVKFVCLNTNALEYDYSEAIPDFTFISNEISHRQSEFSRSVVCMHARPYADVFNNNVALVFERYIRELPHLLFCYNAHGHSIQADDIFHDGTIYYQSDCMQRRSYLLFTITPSGYSYEVEHY